jgi:large subunit ribosomal protein L4
MSLYDVVNWSGEVADSIELEASVFNLEYRPDILHRVVEWQRSGARSGCHKAKQRNEVSGSTRKIYKQKGTGQARHGSIKAPIFIGGGIVFGPVVRSHGYKLNKKVRALGLRVALSKKVSEKNLIVLEDMSLDSYKTALLQAKLGSLGLNSALFVDTGLDENLIKASNGLLNIDVIEVQGINVLDIISHQTLVVSKKALLEIEARLKC